MVSAQGRHDVWSGIAEARVPLALVLGALITGVVLDAFADVGLWSWVSGAAVLMLAWCVAFVHQRKAIATGWLLAAAVGVSGAWHHAFWNLYAQDHISRFATGDAHPVCCTARVLSTPRTPPARRDPFQPYLDGERSQFSVRMRSLRGEWIRPPAPDQGMHAWHPATGKVRVFVNGRVSGVQAGDIIRVFGRLERLSGRRNPGGFSSLDRGRTERIVCRLTVGQPESIQVVGTRSWWDPRWWLEALHDACREALFQYMDDDSARMAAAVLLGDREYLDPQQIDSFFVTGTVHLLAISGLHLAIVVRAFFALAQVLMLPRRASLVLVLALTVLYAALTGGRPPVVRATVLVGMVCLELLYLRPRVSFNSLAAAGIFILAWNPTSVFHAGVQLSFLAVATLIWLSRFERKREMAGDPQSSHARFESATLLPYVLAKLRRHVWYTLLAGCAIWFISIPLVMHRFHLVPLSGLVLNLFLLVPLALSLYCGLMVIGFAWCLPPVAMACGLACMLFLGFITETVKWAEQFELSYGWVSGPTSWGLVVFYAVVIGLGAFQRFSPRWPLWLASAFALLMVTGWVHRLAIHGDDADMKCSFLSVGHGVCIVLELPDDQVWVYDAGSLGSTRSALREISSFLWANRITRLDGIVLSHSDTDHFNIVPALLQRFDVGEIYTTPAMFQSSDGAVLELRRHLELGTVPIRLVSRGARILDSSWGSLTVRHPEANASDLPDNASSLVLDVTCFGKRILLTGDLEGEGLARLLATQPIDCDIMMAPHHGSRHSRPEAVAAWCQPEWVVVSGGNPHGSREAARVYRRAGATVLHTADGGAVTAVLTPQHVHVSSLGWSAAAPSVDATGFRRYLASKSRAVD